MARGRPLDATQELLEEFERGGRVTEYLIGRIPARLWQQPPVSEGRTIAAIVAHIHSVRKTFGKMGGASTAPSLDRKTVSPAEAKRALRTTNDALTSLFRDSLARGEARVRGLPRRTVNMMLYLTQHDAHHRGQLMLRLREFGHDLSGEDVMKVWGWKKV
ncbi:MAG TPA: DinB family protein [Vicinamibacterales bacterium]|nr:DinB family protein [Vicinamibacterales bacterium]